MRLGRRALGHSSIHTSQQQKAPYVQMQPAASPWTAPWSLGHTLLTCSPPPAVWGRYQHLSFYR